MASPKAKPASQDTPCALAPSGPSPSSPRPHRLENCLGSDCGVMTAGTVLVVTDTEAAALRARGAVLLPLDGVKDRLHALALALPNSAEPEEIVQASAFAIEAVEELSKLWASARG